MQLTVFGFLHLWPLTNSYARLVHHVLHFKLPEVRHRADMKVERQADIRLLWPNSNRLIRIYDGISIPSGS